MSSSSSSPHPTPSSSARRTTLEPALTMGLPLTVLQPNAPVKRSATDAGRDVQVLDLPFPTLGIELSLAGFKRGEQGAPSVFASPVVCELLAALLHRYVAAGRPADGVVRFRQRELAEDLGFIEPGERRVPSRVPQQLDTALKHLQFTAIKWKQHEDRWDGGGRAMRHVGITSLTILTTYHLEPELAGRPSRDGVRPPPRSWARFNVDFLALLAASNDVVAFDFDAQRRLKSRTARVLFRTLAYLSSRGEREVPVLELLERLGSTMARSSETRVRELLDGPHEELRKAGVLREVPVYETRAGGVLIVRYEWGRAAILPPDDAWLIRECAIFGLNKTATLSLMAVDRERLLQIVCALRNGDVTPPSNPGGYIRCAVERGWVLSTQQIPIDKTRWGGWRPDQPVTRTTYDTWYTCARSCGLRETDTPWSNWHTQARDELAFEGYERPSDRLVAERVDELQRRHLGLPTWEEFRAEPKRWLQRPMATFRLDLSREHPYPRDMRERLANGR